MKQSILSIFLFFASVFCAADAIAQGCPSPSSATASVTFKRPVPGLLEGEFSVSSTKKVSFASGNLQYNSNTQKWQFAAHQYDYIGDAAGNTSVTTDGLANGNGTADLFGWVGASSSWTDDLRKHGLTASNTSSEYGTGTSENLKDDWGNTMGTGWRTLTASEWEWVLGPASSPIPGTNCRTSSTVNGIANARFAKAYLFGTIHGLIIFPDSYTHPDGVTLPTGINNTYNSWNSNQYSAADWGKMEDAGCVFLPCAGYRSRASVDGVNSSGCYWSSSPTTIATNDAYITSFSNSYFNSKNRDTRYFGSSVRLVKDL